MVCSFVLLEWVEFVIVKKSIGVLLVSCTASCVLVLVMPAGLHITTVCNSHYFHYRTRKGE